MFQSLPCASAGTYTTSVSSSWFSAGSALWSSFLMPHEHLYRQKDGVGKKKNKTKTALFVSRLLLWQLKPRQHSCVAFSKRLLSECTLPQRVWIISASSSVLYNKILLESQCQCVLSSECINCKRRIIIHEGNTNRPCWPIKLLESDSFSSLMMPQCLEAGKVQ